MPALASGPLLASSQPSAWLKADGARSSTTTRCGTADALRRWPGSATGAWGAMSTSALKVSKVLTTPSNTPGRAKSVRRPRSLVVMLFW